MEKIFLDTNIMVDYLLVERPKHPLAKVIFNYCYQGEFHGCISETVITNTAYLLRKVLTQNQLNELFIGFCTFLDVAPTTTQSVIRACNQNKRDLEDSILYQTALAFGCNFVITSDLSDFISIESKELRVFTPEDFLYWIDAKNV